MSLSFKIIFLCLITAIINPNYSQNQFKYSSEAERQFDIAIKMFDKANYQEALSIFDKLIQNYPTHQRTTASFIMAGKAYFELKEYHKSVDVLQKIINSYPESDYLADAHYTLGLDYMMLREHENAAIELLRTMELTSEPKLSSRATSLFESIADEKLTDENLRKILQRIYKLEVRDIVQLKLAEKFYSEGFVPQAEHILENLLNRSVPSKYFERATTLNRKLQKGGVIKIGVLLPIMRNSANSKIKIVAEEVLSGAAYAIDEYKDGFASARNVVLEIKDSERDLSIGEKRMRELSVDVDVLAVIGPLYSNVAVACAKVANEEQLPLLTPTATSDGIAASGKFVFQLNPDLTTRGKAMARYAIYNLGLRKFAVLVSDNLSGNILAESFMKEVENLKGHVLAKETFIKGTDDLRSQLMNLRKINLRGEPQLSFSKKMTRNQISAIIRAGADRDLVDSLQASSGRISVIQLFGSRGKQIADSLQLKVMIPKESGENIEVPCTSIQAVLVSGSDAEEIGSIASQLAYYNIKTQLLCSSGSSDLSQLESNRQYMNGGIFISDYYLDEEDPAYIDFEQTFSAKNKKYPTQNTLFGYDAMKLVLRCIDEGATTRDLLATSLSKVRGFKGLHSIITLQNNRVNSEVQFVKYSNGIIKKIGNISIHQ
jgi:ABC-type branched-subunit amino acid transport system substrate-binding protein